MKIIFAVLALTATFVGAAQAGTGENGDAPSFAQRSFNSVN